MVAGSVRRVHDVGMSTIRRFLTLAPFALAVTLVVGVVYLLGAGGWTISAASVRDNLGGVVYLALFALVVNGLVLAVVLAAVAALGRTRLGPAGALGAALAVVAACAAAYYVADAPWRLDEEEWDLLVLDAALLTSLPAWFTYAVGLAVLGRRAVAAPEPGVPASGA
ncbi:hypothetical protein GCM10010102_34870 [Promicromonospora citrea]|uniref:Uncharacterized protein n=2 Tax=Promicromonospora citrea TaxID=43677 RepID=A0A8H9L505_9MICO|nr:hypothetical protein GCM10010102_34870 [Promicromonospora citrea]